MQRPVQASMQQLLSRVRYRLMLRTFVRLVAVCFVGLALFIVSAALLRWLAVPVAAWLTRPLALVSASLVMVAACGLVAWRRAPTLAQAARVVERQAGLAERLSASLELGDRGDPLAQALRLDAEARAKTIEPGAVAPLALGSRLAWWLVGSVAAVAAVQLLPAHSVQVASAAAITDAAAAVPSANDFIQQLLDTSAQAAPVPAPVTRRNALTDSELQAFTPESGNVAAERPAATVGQAATGLGGASASAEQATASTTPAQLVDRGADLGEVLPAAQPQSPAQAATVPGAETARVDPRNDGTTNPNYNQPATRDQELREHARRREAGSNPGGGDGDQVAMADAAVAGSATAGFDGAGSGEPLPAQPESASDALDLPDVTDSSGRRVTLERLPDMIMDVPLGWLPGATDWAPGVEPAVTHDVALQGELDLLRRYNTPGTDQAP